MNLSWSWLFPWREETVTAHRDAVAAGREKDLVRGRRPLVERIAYELGQHKRANHFVDIVQAVAKGAK